MARRLLRTPPSFMAVAAMPRTLRAVCKAQYRRRLIGGASLKAATSRPSSTPGRSNCLMVGLATYFCRSRGLDEPRHRASLGQPSNKPTNQQLRNEEIRLHHFHGAVLCTRCHAQTYLEHCKNRGRDWERVCDPEQAIDELVNGSNQASGQKHRPSSKLSNQRTIAQKQSTTPKKKLASKARHKKKMLLATTTTRPERSQGGLEGQGERHRTQKRNA
jgi:hypothetical protein